MLILERGGFEGTASNLEDELAKERMLRKIMYEEREALIESQRKAQSLADDEEKDRARRSEMHLRNRCGPFQSMAVQSIKLH